jgi:hypothetical protein
MMQGGAIMKAGRNQYLPADRSARMPEMNDYVVQHIAQGILKLVQTVSHNYSVRSRRGAILERSATVRNLPASEAAAFRRFVNEQGNAFVTNVDDWLESRTKHRRKVAEGPRKPILAGVYAFAFLS